MCGTGASTILWFRLIQPLDRNVRFSSKIRERDRRAALTTSGFFLPGVHVHCSCGARMGSLWGECNNSELSMVF